MRHRLGSRAAATSTLLALGLRALVARAEGEPEFGAPPASASGEATREQAPRSESEHAGGEHEAGEHAAEHNQPHAKLWIGGFGVVLNSSVFGERQESESLAGGGLVFNYGIHEHLILGVIPHIVTNSQNGALEVPIDVTLAVPLHLEHHLMPYFAAGPGFAVLLTPDQASGDYLTKYLLRLTTTVGLELGLRHRVATFLELNMNHMFALGQPNFEYTLQLGSTAGLIFGF